MNEQEFNALQNAYGNIDIRDGCPAGLTHFPGQRLGLTARAQNIPFSNALTGWDHSGQFNKPVIEGILVRNQDAAKLQAALELKHAKNTPQEKARRAAARQRHHQQEVAAAASAIRERFPSLPNGLEQTIAKHAWQIGSGRVGRSRMADDPIYDAVIAHARHQFTNYEQLLQQGWDREDARQKINARLTKLIAQWQTEKTVQA